MSERFNIFVDRKKSAKNAANFHFRDVLEGYELTWERIHFDATLNAYNYNALFHKNVFSKEKLANVSVIVYKLEGEPQHSFRSESIQYL